MIRKLSVIQEDFKALVETFKTESIYKTPAFKKKKKYLEVLRHGTDKDGWFYFVQRLGKDSVAFVLYDSDKGFGILKSYSSPYKQFVLDAFTGSLDKPENTILQTLIEEVKEEAGYTVVKESCTPVGKYKVGTSTNEHVYSFLIDVGNMKQEKKEPENIFEQNTDILWMDYDSVLKDSNIGWRAKMIIQDADRKNLL